jgi:hypothetical protein
LFIGTFNGENLKDRLTSAELDQYLAGKIVERKGGGEGSRDYVAFQGDDCVRGEILAGFEQVVRLDDAPFLQTVWRATLPRAT